jgi:hypothetical protein
MGKLLLPPPFCPPINKNKNKNKEKIKFMRCKTVSNMRGFSNAPLGKQTRRSSETLETPPPAPM